MLEVIEGEIRLSVDGIHAFKAIESDILPNGQLKISCANDGFIGAIRDVRINGEFVNLYQHISGIVGMFRDEILLEIEYFRSCSLQWREVFGDEVSKWSNMR